MTIMLERPPADWTDPPWDDWLSDGPPPVFGPPFAGEPDGPQRPKQVAVVGVNVDTEDYLDACKHCNVRLVGLVGPASELTSKLSADGRVRVFRDLDELIASDVEVELLVIVERNPRRRPRSCSRPRSRVGPCSATSRSPTSPTRLAGSSPRRTGSGGR